MGRPLFPTWERTKEMVGSAASSVMDMLGSGPNPAMMAGSAGVNPLTATNVPAFPSRLGPLVRTDYGLPPSERPDWRNPADQWDARPVKSAPTQFAGTNPRAATADDIAFFYGRGKYAPAGQVQQTAAAEPQPAASPNANKLPIQTPYGMVYASNQTPEGGGPSQAMSDRVTEMAGLPAQSARLANIGKQAQRSAAIAQMRQQGAALARQSIERQEQFFAQKRAERAALAQATGEAYKAGMSPQSVRQARSAYTSQQPTSIAGIQRQFAQMAPNFRSPMSERTAFVRSPFNIPSGGPQPNQGMNFAAPTPILNNERFGSPFSFNFGYGA